MAMKCVNCNKGISYGHRVSHAKNRSNRLFKPNLQYARIVVGGKKVRMKLCANCIKLYRKNHKETKLKVESGLPSDTHSQSLSVS